MRLKLFKTRVNLVKKTYIPALLTILAGLSSTPAHAQEQRGYLSLGIGYYDVLPGEGGATDFRAEYRPANPVFLGAVRPWVGLEITSDQTVWAGGGFLGDIMLSNNVYLTPSIGVGLYAQGDSEVDLDYPIEFRSQLELGYQFEGADRVGVAFGHISNASVGDDNPGTEILNVYYHFPLASMF
jgi:hypothetical protein